MSADLINVAVIGCGGITFQNHIPGLALCPNVRIAAVCDTDGAAVERARAQTGAAIASLDYTDILKRDDIHAVIIATPNCTHAPIALEAVGRRKHVLCEKPLAMNYAEAIRMADAAERSNVRHMTAFTYRFVPAMRYLTYLVKQGDLGNPYHFRSCRLQDWGTRDLGWRQIKNAAGSGELGDMLSHRIDFAHLLLGSISRLVAMVKQWHPERGGRPNDLEDWAALIAEFRSGATGVLESSKLASGRNESWRSFDYVEINGSERSFVFTTGDWNKLRTGKLGGPGLETIDVPREFWKSPNSPRDSGTGDPLVTFRYDQAWEFVDAIRSQRPCRPDFYDGARAQAVVDAALQSAGTGQWVELDEAAEAAG
ncbi:MAG TPA: Gfo/Idh/MocA family oxidoreductase [Terriglobia bacterium]|nr:Gfo/Idh/MocA family oxidoreductase [Terriglobia bacterium]